MPSMIIAVDLNVSVTKWNKAASQKTGISTESALGKPLIELIPGLTPHYEINNPLAGMMQSAEVLYGRLSNDEIPANSAAAEKAGLTLSGVRTYMDEREILPMLQGIKASGNEQL